MEPGRASTGGVREFLRFLDETGQLHPASTRAATLLKELDRLAPRFPAVMADSSRWRLVKRVFTAMMADGVPVDDDAKIDRWAERFSALGPADRRFVLGELMAERSRLRDRDAGHPRRPGRDAAARHDRHQVRDISPRTM